MAAARIAYARRIDLGALLESQQPVIDLNTQEYEVATRRFLKAIQAYTTRGIEEIKNRQNKHSQELKKISEKKAAVEVETTACKVKEIELMKVLEKETVERKEAESSVNELKRQFSAVKEKTAMIDEEIQQCRDEVTRLLQEQHRDSSTLEKFASWTDMEQREYESWLKCSIEGVKQGKLVICFKQVDPTELSRECTVILDVSSREYEVPTTTPPLPTLPLLLDNLNKTRDLYRFIKDVRKAFQDIYSER